MSYLSPCQTQAIKVYNRIVDGKPITVVDFGNGSFLEASPGLWLRKGFDAPGYEFKDRIGLTYSGGGFSDKSPEQIQRQDGTKVGFYDDVVAYFDELGIGVQTGGGGDVTTEQFQAALLRITLLENRVTVLEQSSGYTKLDTPVVSVGSLTYNSATASWSAIPNATSYDVYLDSVLKGNTTDLSYPLNGLTEETDYSVGVVAVGTIPFLDSDSGTYDFSTPAQGGGAIFQLNSATLLNENTLLYA